MAPVAYQLGDLDVPRLVLVERVSDELRARGCLSASLFSGARSMHSNAEVDF
jgi:hypothetical protein